MKKIGEILFKARKDKQVSLLKLAKKTKIDPVYIKAIEKGDYAKLPGPTFIKGFIRNLSQALDKNPEDMVALFRRDFHLVKKSDKKEDQEIIFQTRDKHLVSTRMFIIATFILVFGGYLIFQYRGVLRAPKLEVTQPQANSIVSSPLKTEGSSEPGVTIKVNGVNIAADPTGYFSTQIELPAGDHEVRVEAVSRFGKSSVKIIHLTVISTN